MGGLRVTLPVIGSTRRGTEFVEQPVKSVLNSPESTGMPFWSLNPYVGCEFGCTYCYARFAHGFAVERAGAEPTGEPAWERFEHLILVKRREAVLAALDRDLAKLRRRAADGPQTVAIGTATDPYQPAERRFSLTRAVLGRLGAERGLRVGIVTKSALVTRDIDLLTRLGRRNEVAVQVSLTSADPRMIRLFERRSPMPAVRLRALGRLARAGIRAGLICAPVLPGVTDGASALRALVERCAAAGARFAFAVPLRLPPGARDPFLPVIATHFPALHRRYVAAYATGAGAPIRYKERLSRRFGRIVRAAGLSTRPFDGPDGEPTQQLALWEPRGRMA